MSTERGNRKRMKAISAAVTPASPSEFEHLVAMLGLSPEQYESSTVLKEWARKNKNDKYVPTELLEAWRFKVKPDA